MIGGPRPTKSSARQLLAAGVVDLMAVMVVLRMIAAPLVPELRRIIPEPAVYCGLFLALLILYWVVTEMVLSGRTLGRAALGLEMRGKNGAPLARGRIFARAMGKLTTFGLTGLKANAPAGYNRRAGALWMSPMAPRRLQDWELIVLNGAHRGRRVKLGDHSAFRKTGQLRIGRDPAWATFPLPSDASVSRQHCTLIAKNNGLFIHDQSQGGSFINGRPVPKGKPVPIGGATELNLSGVVIRIVR